VKKERKRKGHGRVVDEARKTNSGERHNEGHTPADIATHCGHHDIANAIRAEEIRITASRRDVLKLANSL
jgi:hypothetical protein